MVSDPPDRGFPARGREDRLAIPIENVCSRSCFRDPPCTGALSRAIHLGLKAWRTGHVVDKLSQLGRLGEAKIWRYAPRTVLDDQKGAAGCRKRDGGAERTRMAWSNVLVALSGLTRLLFPTHRLEPSCVRVRSPRYLGHEIGFIRVSMQFAQSVAPRRFRVVCRSVDGPRLPDIIAWSVLAYRLAGYCPNGNTSIPVTSIR